MSHHRDLSDVEWAVLDPPIPKPKRRKDGRGRPRRERPEVLNGILFILCTGAPWADLPDRYPPYQTCHRRFQHWVRSGVIRGVLTDWPKIYVFGVDSILRKPSLMEALPLQRKGVQEWARLSAGRVQRSARWQTGLVCLIAVCAESATAHEVTLVQQTLSDLFVAEPIERLIGNNGYDSDRLDRALADTGVRELSGSLHGFRTSAVSRLVGNTA